MPPVRPRGTKRRRAEKPYARPARMQVDAAPRYVSNARIGGFLGIEKKFYDTSRAAVAIVASTDASGAEYDPAAVNCLNAPAQGDGESNRDGRQIRMKSLLVRGAVYCPSQADQTAADVSPTVRVMAVLDTQTNGAQLNSEDVFTNPAGSGTTATSPFRNLQYSKRFRVLASKKVQFPPFSPTWDGTNLEQCGQAKDFQMSVNLKDLVVNFVGTTAGVASVADNSIHIIAYTNSTAAAPTLSYNSRLRFVG